MIIRRLTGSSVVRLFSAAVIDQAMISATNFLVGLLLIRYSSDAQYGYFVLAVSAIQLLVTTQGAWAAGPLSVLAPKRSDERRDQMIGAVESSQARFLKIFAALACPAPAVVYMAGWCTAEEAMIGSATIIAGWMTLRRELMRSILMIYSRPQSVLFADFIYVLALIVLAVVAVLLSPMAGLFTIVALAAASVVGKWQGRRVLVRDFQLNGQRRTDVWPEFRHIGTWATVSVIIYWIYSQSYNFILAARMDLGAVADVNAARLMLMPMVLLIVGVNSLLAPKASYWLHHDGLSALLRRLWMFFFGLLIIDLAYVLFLWLIRNWISDEVMRTTIDQLDFLLILWAVQCGLGMARDVFQAALVALEQHRKLAWLTGASAIVALVGIMLGIDQFGAAGAVVGTIAGELVNLCGVVVLLYLKWRESDSGPDTMPEPQQLERDIDSDLT